ncbi:MAG: thrombospondin type 3 repeat-containing protein [Myxococcales bacterium]|nr:thrombospondin type 3 repeat-containing protein [Myxococcales bacterium]
MKTPRRRLALLALVAGLAACSAAPVAADADVDADGDGIPDLTDVCPSVPEDADGFQDADGCPEPDNDEDGIPDVADKCPLEPEDHDGDRDDDGCRDFSPPPPSGCVLINGVIAFSPGDARLVKDARSWLAELATTLRGVPELPLRIIGRPDTAGEAGDLAARRAAAVRDALVAEGVDAARLALETEATSPAPGQVRFAVPPGAGGCPGR